MQRYMYAGQAPVPDRHDLPAGSAAAVAVVSPGLRQA